jgi:threonine synthase
MLEGTPSLRARRLESFLHLGALYVKHEGANVTGTHKDRLAAVQVAYAKSRGFKAVSVGTCGNHGTALAYAAKKAGLACIIFAPSRYHLPRLAEMRMHGAEVHLVDGPYEAAVEASVRYASDRGIYDANPGARDHAERGREAYGAIAREIVESVGHVDVVAVPMGNGTAIYGIQQGFEQLRREGKIARVPQMIGASTEHGNPILDSFRQGSPVVTDLNPEHLKETHVNEPLVSIHPYDGDHALESIRSSGGQAVSVSDAEMLRMTSWLKRLENIQALPAATAGLAAIERVRPTGVCVAVVTSRAH